MEAVVSPSAPAETTTQEDPRELLFMWYRLSPTSNGMCPPDRAKWTFCLCCGSQFMNENGEIGMAASAWVRPSPTAGENYYKQKYGPDAPVRFSPAEWSLMVSRFNRYNKPGVTLAYLPLKEAIEVLYDEDHRPLADGYEINDKEHGTMSVLWLNA